MRKYFLCFLVIALLWGCKNKPEEPPTVAETPPAEVKTETAQAVPQEAGTVPNHPPHIKTLIVVPKYPKLGESVRAEALAEDQDGDTVSLTYKWSRNGEALSEKSDTLVLKDGIYKRGDTITLDVVPDDGRDRGKPAFAKITLGNSPPEVISSAVPANIANRSYTYQVKAADPDGDPLTYALKTAPSGMTIDPSTGLIQWNIPPGFQGNAQLTVSVTDGRGGEAVQTLAIEIKPGQQK